MKTISKLTALWIMVLLSICTTSLAQTGSLYGIRTAASNYSNQLIKINPITGSITSASVNFGKGLVFGSSTIDPNAKVFYCLIPGDTLYAIDLVTSTVLSNAKLSSAGTYSAPILEFNSYDNTLYGVSHKLSDNRHYLTKINPSTGSVTVLSTSSFSSMNVVTGSSITPSYLMTSSLDPINNLFYTSSDYFSDTLYGFNLTTGNIQIRTKLATTFSFSVPTYYSPLMEFSCSDTTLYAMVKYSGDNRSYLSKLNPLTGSVTVISVNGVSPIYLNGVSTLDPVTKKFFHASPIDSIYTTNLSSGNLSNKYKLINSGYYNPILEYEKICLGSSTSIEITLNDEVIQVYPNPASSILYIKSEEAMGKSQLVIFDLLGKTVLENKSTDLYQTSINIEELNSGIYFLSVKFDNNKSIVKKFVKN